MTSIAPEFEGTVLDLEVACAAQQKEARKTGMFHGDRCTEQEIDWLLIELRLGPRSEADTELARNMLMTLVRMGSKAAMIRRYCSPT